MSHVAAQEAGQLSVLAALLAPYAGSRGEDVARRLLRRFGSLRTIYSASHAALAEAVAEAGEFQTDIAAAIVAARQIAEAAARESLRGEPTDTGSTQFRHYLVRRLGARREEYVMVLFLTGEGFYIAEDLYAGGGLADCRIPLRRTVRRAFDLDARRVVLAHNHPSGTAQPSAADIIATARFRQVVEELEIVLDDHCVVAGNYVASMREMGLLRP